SERPAEQPHSVILWQPTQVTSTAPAAGPAKATASSARPARIRQPEGRSCRVARSEVVTWYVGSVIFLIPLIPLWRDPPAPRGLLYQPHKRPGRPRSTDVRTDMEYVIGAAAGAALVLFFVIFIAIARAGSLGAAFQGLGIMGRAKQDPAFAAKLQAILAGA